MEINNILNRDITCGDCRPVKPKQDAEVVKPKIINNSNLAE